MIPARAHNLSHRYGDNTVLRELNLDVQPGQLVGLLGPNGAGKSTLLNLLNGQRKPTAGKVELFGGNPRHAQHRRRIGVTPQDSALPATLRVAEVVDFVRAHFSKAVNRDELLERFGLCEISRRQTGGLSGGQRRRLSVALAFAGNPDLVFLDEPTTGLDITARHTLWDAIRAFHNTGGTVLLTSHYLEEIETLAQRVIVLGHGRVLVDDSVEAVRRRVGVHKVSFAAETVPSLPGVIESTRDNERVELLTAEPDQLVRDLVRAGGDFTELRIDQASLEDAFVHLTSD